MSEAHRAGPWISDAHAAPGLPGEAQADVDDIPAHYWRAFAVVAFTMNRFIVDQVLRASRFFDNDAETMLLYGMLAHLNVAHIVPPGSRPSERLDADGRVPGVQPQLRPVRLRDLEQITGRPRETIRRRLDRLVKSGRIRRVVEGYVLEVGAVDSEMLTLSVDGVKRFMQTAGILERALEDARCAMQSGSAASPGAESDSGRASDTGSGPVRSAAPVPGTRSRRAGC